tara:strand:+ start:194 stop:436 length:243 start_codon:yes stop_codon:yes gene_type:complete
LLLIYISSKLYIANENPFSFILFLQFSSIWAQKNLPKEDTTKLKTEQLKEVILIVHTMPGSKFEIKNKTGAASYISKEHL